MKNLLIVFFLLLSITAFSQFRMVGSATWSTLNDSTYQGTVSFQSDLTGMGYLATHIVDTFRLFTPVEKIYRIDSVWNKTFSSATLRIVEILGTQGVPVGQVMVFNPDGRNTIPQNPFGSTGATAQLNAAVDTWNARQIGTGGTPNNGKCLERQHTQAGHAFSIGDAVFWDADTLKLASVNSLLPAQAVVTGFVPDSDIVIIAYTGECETTSAHGFTQDSAYYTARIGGQPVIESSKPDTTQFLFKSLNDTTLVLAIGNMYLGGLSGGNIAQATYKYCNTGTSCLSDSTYTQIYNTVDTVLLGTPTHNGELRCFDNQTVGSVVLKPENVATTEIAGDAVYSLPSGQSICFYASPNGAATWNWYIVSEGNVPATPGIDSTFIQNDSVFIAAGGQEYFSGMAAGIDSFVYRQDSVFAVVNGVEHLSGLDQKTTAVGGPTFFVNPGNGNEVGSQLFLEPSFNSSSGWTVSNATISSGQLTISTSGGYAEQTVVLEIGKGYLVTAVVTSVSQGVFIDINSNNVTSIFSPGTLTHVFVATQSSNTIKFRGQHVASNIITEVSLKEFNVNYNLINFKKDGKQFVFATNNNNWSLGDSSNYFVAGARNISFGSSALKSATSASDNIAIGYRPLWNASTATRSIAIGNYVLANSVGSTNNIGIGHRALNFNTTGSDNVAFGFDALYKNTTGSVNFGLGKESLLNNLTGSDNVGLGNSSLRANTSGNYNIGIGSNSFYFNTTGSNNIAIGFDSGRRTNSSGSNTFSSNCIFIGIDSRSFAASNVNQIVIGNSALSLGDSSVVIGRDIKKFALGNNLVFKTNQTIGAGQDNYVLTYDHAAGSVSLEAPVVDNLGNHTATTNLAMAQFDINNANKITSDTVATTNITNLSKAESPTGGTAKSRIIMGTALSIPTSIRTENTANANQYGQLAVDADGITSLIQVNGSQEAGLKIEADSIVNLYTSGNNSIGFVGDTAKVITNNITAIQVVPTGKVEIKDYLLAETTASPAQAEKFAILPVDCSGGAKTVTPPASPVAGDWFAVSDSRASAGANNITVDTSGDKLHGGANDYIMNANADYVRFTYVNATIGWIKSN